MCKVVCILSDVHACGCGAPLRGEKLSEVLGSPHAWCRHDSICPALHTRLCFEKLRTCKEGKKAGQQSLHSAFAKRGCLDRGRWANEGGGGFDGDSWRYSGGMRKGSNCQRCRGGMRRCHCASGLLSLEGAVGAAARYGWAALTFVFCKASRRATAPESAQGGDGDACLCVQHRRARPHGRDS